MRSGGADWPTLGYHLFVRTGTTSSAATVKLFITLSLINDDIGGIPKITFAFLIFGVEIRVVILTKIGRGQQIIKEKKGFFGTEFLA